jgi:hypothetical protein
MILDGQRYFTDKEVARKYEVSVRWVRQIRYKSKDFPYYKLNGRVFYKQDEVEKWFKHNLVPM